MKEQAYGDMYIGHYKDNIVQMRPIEHWQGKDDLETAKIMMDGTKATIGTERPKGLLVISQSGYKRMELMKYYLSRDLNEVARAMVVDSFAAKILGNMYAKISRNTPNENGRVVPFKLFSDKEKAVAWLEEQIKQRH